VFPFTAADKKVMSVRRSFFCLSVFCLQNYLECPERLYDGPSNKRFISLAIDPDYDLCHSEI